MYAFFKPDVRASEIDGRRCHTFACAGRGCSKRVIRFLDTGDAKSTGNLRRHIKSCKAWGSDALEAAEGISSIEEAREAVQAYARSGDLKLAFASVKKKQGKPMYSTLQRTPAETR